MTPSPPGPIARFLSADHRRLDALLARAAERAGEVNRAAYDAFRAGLLRHIALEEKILLPAARKAGGGEPLPMVRRIRIDHGAVASLLVACPTPELVSEIRSILGPHGDAEEGPGGLYQSCEALLAGEAEPLLERMRAYPRVKTLPYRDGPGVFRRAADALAASARQR